MYTLCLRKDYISEKLAALKKGKFGEMVDFSGPSDPSEAPQEFQYTTTDAFYTQPESEPMATSVDQVGYFVMGWLVSPP